MPVTRRHLLGAAAAAFAARTVGPALALEAPTLAPTGTLRIGVYLGSPTSLVRGPDGDARGVTVEVGRALAKRLGVPAELKEYPRVAEVVEALRRGEVDMTVTNASPARAQLVAFTEPLVALELGVLVRPGSTVNDPGELNARERRVGVSEGGTSAGALARVLPDATVVPVPSLARGIALLREGGLDAFATNKGILFQMSDELPGSRILPGRWGLEHLALAVPTERAAALPGLAPFLSELRSSGLLADAAARAGLRGMAP